MFLLIILCLMKLLEMTTNRIQRNKIGGCGGGGVVEKENRAINGHFRNCLSGKNGIKSIRGMTDYLNNDKLRLQQFCPTHNNQQPYKRPLTSPNTVHPSQLPYYNNGNGQATTVPPLNGNSTVVTVSPSTPSTKSILNELSDSHLRANVEIVLKNLNRYALRGYIDNELGKTDKLTKLNNNNNNNNNNNYYFYNSKMATSPESDCNSNLHVGGTGGVGAPPLLNCSYASSQDFTHDNSDYQWFLEYGYREGVSHQSILSSLSASYNGIGELSYYEDLAKNIDANLAEVDMGESFRTEHIHSLLTTIPSICKETSTRHHDLDNSICKAKQLFSPVKESILSVDSLDMDGYGDDGDIILTCQANKNNYTIAFEGSAMYSDESFYDGHQDVAVKNNQLNTENNTSIGDIAKQKALESSMSRSDTGFTTWSKLKKNSMSQLQRYPSGNNNTSMNHVPKHAPHCLVRKSGSLPNLRIPPQTTDLDNAHLSNNQLHASQTVSNSTIDTSYGKMRTLLPMCPMPISSTSESESPVPPLQQSNTSNEQQQPNPPSFNLVKLFIKQKSSSSETCMDVSSGCWPSDSSSSTEQRIRKKSMNDSGKGSALSRHDEDNESDFQYDSLDIPPNEQPDNRPVGGNKPKSNDLYREVFDSPSHRNYKECNLNIRNAKQSYSINNNNSFEKDSSKETNNRSLTDTSRTSDNITQVLQSTNMITRSMQTSALMQRSKASVKVVAPSFLAQLHKNSQISGSNQSAPVYVIYPNYALPDLGFVKTAPPTDVILSPVNFKETFPRKRRPVSLADADSLGLKKYEHVVDWQSLATLLPDEYRKMLRHIPEVERISLDPTVSQKPMFCMSPPLRRSHQLSCDCASYYTTSSSGSGNSSGQPPSSGFRGSSTMLTDSEFEEAIAASNNNDSLRNLYIYQYETGEMGAVERPPSGRPGPKGILRRTNSKTRSKRNSMFEETHAVPHSTPDKRRSLQEPFYGSETHNIIEDYLADLDEYEALQSANKLNNSRVSSYRQYYPDDYCLKTVKTNLNYIMELKNNVDNDARVRAENFLSNVPKSELKYYAEIANILESIDNGGEYDRNKLRNDVSRALAQKKVSFNQQKNVTVNTNLLTTGIKEFTTPPNSPNISVTALRMERKSKSTAELAAKREKIQSNRFKRLQIQWELLSKDSTTLEKELIKETRSGGSTPTSAKGLSKIPRPVSYPATRPATAPTQPVPAKTIPSPSRIVRPKKYGINVMKEQPSPTTISRPRTPNKLHNTPKKVPLANMPRPTARTR